MVIDGGVMHRLRLRNWPFLQQYETKSSIVGVDLSSVAPLLVLLLTSVLVSVAVLLVERGSFVLWRRRLRTASRWERIASRQRSVLHATTPSRWPLHVAVETAMPKLLPASKTRQQNRQR
jgi:hypothetical protein